MSHTPYERPKGAAKPHLCVIFMYRDIYNIYMYSNYINICNI